MLGLLLPGPILLLEALMHRATPEERRLCVILAYALMGLRHRNADRFEIIAQTIIDNAPELADLSRGRELLRELLLVKGGRGMAKILAAGLLAQLADDIYIAVLHCTSFWIGS